MTRISFTLLAFALAAPRLAAAPPADVWYEQRIGQQLPMQAAFTDENGEPRTLGSLLGGKPAVLIFKYYRCPELCSLVSSGATDALRQLKQTVGRDYVVITVSIDPTDTSQMARAHQQGEASRYGRTGSPTGWHALVGRPDQIRSLAEAAGFHYAYDVRSRQYAHPSGLVIVTPRGIVSSYFLGVDFAAPELAEALDRAGQNRTGKSVFSLLFTCFQGGDTEGRYGGLIWTILSAAVAVTVISVGGGICAMLRSEFRDRRQRGGRGT
jgi:protein SCO1/2